jgi:hypothetical protein
MKKIIVLALLSFVAESSFPQGVDSSNKEILGVPMSDYFNCVIAYSKRLAPSKELPADIATAALATCEGKVTAIKEAYLGGPEGRGLRQKNWPELLSYTENLATKGAIKTVLDARYPQTSKK